MWKWKPPCCGDSSLTPDAWVLARDTLFKLQKPHVINGKEIDCNNALCKSQLPPPKKHRSEEEVAVGMAQGIMMMELKVAHAVAIQGAQMVQEVHAGALTIPMKVEVD